MACETTSVSSLGFEYILATGESTTALGKAAANRATIAIPDMGLLSAYRSRVVHMRRRDLSSPTEAIGCIGDERATLCDGLSVMTLYRSSSFHSAARVPARLPC